MTFSKPTDPQDDEVSSLIDALYNELMMLRFEYMDFRKSASKQCDQDKNYLTELLEKIEFVNDDFESLIKSHTLYLKFKKATGHGKTTHSSEMLTKIQEIKGNVGQIVSMIPKPKD